VRRWGWGRRPERVGDRGGAIRHDSSYYVRRVNWQGRFLWGGERLALSAGLAGELIGLKEVEDSKAIKKYIENQQSDLDDQGFKTTVPTE
jgi:hypothetical protein